MINLYVVLVFKSSEGRTILTRPIRTESDIKQAQSVLLFFMQQEYLKNIYNINVSMQYQLQTLELLFKKIYVKKINYFKLS